MRSKKILVEKLVTDAVMESWSSSGDGKHFDRMCHSDGYKNLPERYKPGRMIAGLSSEDREVLKTVTAKDFDHRVKR